MFPEGGIEDLARRFQARDVSRAEWTHEAHLAVGLWHVARFGAAEALQLRAQLLPIGVPLQFLIMLPYVLTIVVLAGFAGRSGAPNALGRPLPRR